MARQVLIIEDTPGGPKDVEVTLEHEGLLDAPFEERPLSLLIAQYLYGHIDSFADSIEHDEGNDDPTDLCEDDECDE